MKSSKTSQRRLASRARKPVRRSNEVKKIFERIEQIRLRAKPLPKGVTIKDLIEEGRT